MVDIFSILAQKKQEIDAKSGRRAKTAKLPTGKSRWRILPGWRGGDDQQFWHDFGQHFLKGPEDLTKVLAAYVCVDSTFGKPCEICQGLQTGIMATRDDRVLKALEEGKASKRIVVNACRRDSSEPDKVEVLELPPSVFAQFADAAGTFHKDGVNVIDLESGHDVWFSKEGSGKSTKYGVTLAVKATAIPAAVMGNLHNLDEYVSQEYEQGKQKAITAVSFARGLGPAPAISGPGGSTSNPGAMSRDPGSVIENAEYVVREERPASPMAAVVPQPEPPKVVPIRAQPAPIEPPVVAPVAPAAANAATDDLEDLLREVGLQ